MQVLQSGCMLLLPEMVEQGVIVTRRAVANQETGLTGCPCTRSRIMAADANQNKDYSAVHACGFFHLSYAVDEWQSTHYTFHISYSLPLTMTRSVSAEQ